MINVVVITQKDNFFIPRNIEKIIKNNSRDTNLIGVSVIESKGALNRNFNFIDYKENLKNEKEFLNYFSLKYKLKFRIKLLFSKDGRKLLREEILRKYFKKI